MFIELVKIPQRERKGDKQEAILTVSFKSIILEIDVNLQGSMVPSIGSMPRKRNIDSMRKSSV